MKPWLGKSSWSTARGAGIKTCVSLFGAKGFSGCGFRALGVQGLAFGVAGTAKFEQEAPTLLGNLNPKNTIRTSLVHWREWLRFQAPPGCHQWHEMQSRRAQVAGCWQAKPTNNL